jgi:hypothetical protein
MIFTKRFAKQMNIDQQQQKISIRSYRQIENGGEIISQRKLANLENQSKGVKSLLNQHVNPSKI